VSAALVASAVIGVMAPMVGRPMHHLSARVTLYPLVQLPVHHHMLVVQPAASTLL
jgi:hypothetical protein